MKSASKGGAKAAASASGGNAGPAKQLQKVKAIGGDQGTNLTEVTIYLIHMHICRSTLFNRFVF